MAPKRGPRVLEELVSERIRVGVIYGSARPGRFCETVVRWVAERVGQSGRFEIELIDPATPPDGVSSASVKERLAQAEAFVVVTPEYNHGYTAALKSLIDSYGVEWHAKPVAFVSYGGVSGGLRAVEQLRLVFAELHAVTIRDSVSFAGAWEQFDGEGKLRNPERALRTMDTVLKRLHWWAVALRNAQAAEPYLQVS
jgi:NAD(P)H-dependent FMN reductase